MARKGWQSLSDAYRKRLQKAGISESDYAGGASIKSARGHAATPERPIGYNAKAFPQYSQRRGSLEQQVQQRKEELFGDRPRWNSTKSLMHIRTKPPTFAQMRWFLAAEPDEVWDAIRQDYEGHSWIGYN